MPSLIERLDALHARTQDPDKIAQQLFIEWKHCGTLSQEYYDKMGDVPHVIGHGPSGDFCLLSGIHGGWTPKIWSGYEASVRTVNSVLSGDYWILPLSEYNENPESTPYDFA